MNAPPPVAGVEVEVAVTRGDQFLARGVLRSGATLTVGHGRDAVVVLDESEAPQLWPLLEVEEGSASLAFTDAMDLQFAVDGVLKSGQELIGAGVAVERQAPDEGASWSLVLGIGGQATVRFGERSFLIKARAVGSCDEVAPSSDTPGLCGHCARVLPPPLPLVGALRPCDGCGVLNGAPVDDLSEDAVTAGPLRDPDLESTELGIAGSGSYARALEQRAGEASPPAAGAASAGASEPAPEQAAADGVRAEAPPARQRRKSKTPAWTRLQLTLLLFGLVSGVTGLGLIALALLGP